VGSGGFVSARVGVEADAGAVSLGPAFNGGVGSGTGSAAGEGREAEDSQVDSGRHRDHSHNPALNAAQKIASQEMGLWKNLRILLIRASAKRNFQKSCS